MEIPELQRERDLQGTRSTGLGSLVFQSSVGIMNVGGDRFVQLALIFGSDNSYIN